MAKKIIFGKKAQFNLASKMIYWMIAGVMVTITVLSFAFVISNYQGDLVGIPPELNAELISLRFFNTAECFAYQDPVTTRIYPGVIDLSKFTPERLDNCYRTEHEKGFKDFNFGLKLEGFTSIGEDGSEGILMTNNYFNNVDFTLYRNVLVRSNGELSQTRMVIFVQEKI